MTDTANPFAEEWRDCLRAHYKHAVRENDTVTLRTLVGVLQGQIGFTDDEMQRLYIEATMHVDDIRFVPPLALHTPAPVEEAPAFQPHPLECQCPACLQINLTPHDDDGQPLDADAIAELEERAPRKPDDNAPVQLSLF